jgi:hypothetical protein
MRFSPCDETFPKKNKKTIPSITRASAYSGSSLYKFRRKAPMPKGKKTRFVTSMPKGLSYCPTWGRYCHCHFIREFVWRMSMCPPFFQWENGWSWIIPIPSPTGRISSNGNHESGKPSTMVIFHSYMLVYWRVSVSARFPQKWWICLEFVAISPLSVFFFFGEDVQWKPWISNFVRPAPNMVVKVW